MNQLKIYFFSWKISIPTFFIVLRLYQDFSIYAACGLWLLSVKFHYISKKFTAYFTHLYKKFVIKNTQKTISVEDAPYKHLKCNATNCTIERFFTFIYKYIAHMNIWSRCLSCIKSVFWVIEYSNRVHIFRIISSPSSSSLHNSFIRNQASL